MDQVKRQALKKSLEEDAILITKVQTVLGSDKFSQLDQVLENEELFHEFKNATILDNSILDNESLLPLTNVALAYSKFMNLQKLLQKEVNAREFVETEIGKESVQKILELVKQFEGKDFIDDDINESVHLYHSVRNLAVKCVLERLYEIYSNPKMAPILSKETDHVEYNSAISNLKYLVTVPWKEKFAKAENLDFDLDFLKIILEYWQMNGDKMKQAKDGVKSDLQNETKKTKSENNVVHSEQKSNNVTKTNREKEEDTSEDVSKKQVEDTSSTPNEQVEETSSSHSEKVKETSSTPNEQVEETSSSHNEKVKETSSTPNEQAEETSSSRNEQIEKTTSTLNEHVEETSSRHNGHIEETSSNSNEQVEETSSSHNGHIEETSSIPSEHVENTSSNSNEQIEETSSSHNEHSEETSSIPNEHVEETSSTLNEQVQEASSIPNEQIKQRLQLLKVSFSKTKVKPDPQLSGSQHSDTTNEQVEETSSTHNEQVKETSINPNEQVKETFSAHNEQVEETSSISNPLLVSTMHGSQQGKLFVSSNIGKLFISKTKSDVLENEETETETETTMTNADEVISSVPIEEEVVSLKSNVKITNENLCDEFSIGSIKKLKEDIFNSPEIKKKIADIAGEDKLEQFLKMVDVFDESEADLSVNNVKVKSLYHCIRNASLSDPIQLLNSTLYPLSNLSLSVDMFNHLLELINKEKDLKNLVKQNAGEAAFERFEDVIERYLERGNEYIEEDITFNITCYHSMRNFALKYVFSKLNVIFKRIKTSSGYNSNGAEYVTAIERVKKLLKMDWNQQAVNSEENEFDFNFLVTILNHWENDEPDSAEDDDILVTILNHWENDEPDSTEDDDKSNCKPDYGLTMENIIEQTKLKSKEPLLKNSEPIIDHAKSKSDCKPDYGQMIKDWEKSQDKPTIRIRQLSVDISKLKSDSSKEAEKNKPIVKDKLTAVQIKLQALGVQINPQVSGVQIKPKVSGVQIKPQVSGVKIKPPNSVDIIRSREPTEEEDPDDPDAIADNDNNEQDGTKDFVKANQSTKVKVESTKKVVSKTNNSVQSSGVKICCSLCSDRNSSNLDALLRHYSLKHFRDSIERKYVSDWTGSCHLCKKTLNSKPELVMHIGVEHDAVELDIAASKGGFQCPVCKKGFLNEIFYKQHIIGMHFGSQMAKEFLTSGYKLKCKFCTKEFANKQSILFHIGIDHNKIESYLIERKKKSHESKSSEKIKCKFCDFTSEFVLMKVHYLENHFFQKLEAKCKEENLLHMDNICQFCNETSKDQNELIKHLGIKHNQILKFIDSVPAKFVKAQFKTEEDIEEKDDEENVDDMDSIYNSDPPKLPGAPTDSKSPKQAKTNISYKLTKSKNIEGTKEEHFSFDPLFGPLNDFTRNLYNKTLPKEQTAVAMPTLIKSVIPLKPKFIKLKQEPQLINNFIPKTKIDPISQVTTEPEPQMLNKPSSDAKQKLQLLKVSFSKSKVKTEPQLQNEPISESQHSDTLTSLPLKPLNSTAQPPETQSEEFVSCKVCKKVVLFEDFNKHFFLTHYRKLALSKLKEEQQSAELSTLICPNQSCLKVSKDEDDLITHFATEHTNLSAKVSNLKLPSIDTSKKLVNKTLLNKPGLNINFTKNTILVANHTKEPTALDVKKDRINEPVLDASVASKFGTKVSNTFALDTQLKATQTYIPTIKNEKNNENEHSTPSDQIKASQTISSGLKYDKTHSSSSGFLNKPVLETENTKMGILDTDSTIRQIPDTSGKKPNENLGKNSFPAISNDNEVQVHCQPCKFIANGDDQLSVHRQTLGHKFKVIKNYSNTGNAANRICLVCKKEFPQKGIFNHLEIEHRSKYIFNMSKIRKNEESKETKNSILNVKVESIASEESMNVSKRKISDPQLKEKESEHQVEEKETKHSMEIKKIKCPYWFLQFKDFCAESKNLRGVQDFQKSDFRICNSSVLNYFFKRVFFKDNNISKFDDIIKEIGETGLSFEDGKSIQDLQIVKQYSLIKEYQLVCKNLGTSMENCDIMHIIIFLSQILARTDVSKKNVEWTLLTISSCHANINGEPLKADKKIVDFFEAIGIKLQNVQNEKPTSQKEQVQQSKKVESLPKVVCLEMANRPLRSLPTNNNKTKENKTLGIGDISQIKRRRARNLGEQDNESNSKSIEDAKTIVLKPEEKEKSVSESTSNIGDISHLRRKRATSRNFGEQDNGSHGKSMEPISMNPSLDDAKNVVLKAEKKKEKSVSESASNKTSIEETKNVLSKTRTIALDVGDISKLKRKRSTSRNFGDQDNGSNSKSIKPISMKPSLEHVKNLLKVESTPDKTSIDQTKNVSSKTQLKRKRAQKLGEQENESITKRIEPISIKPSLEDAKTIVLKPEDKNEKSVSQSTCNKTSIEETKNVVSQLEKKAKRFGLQIEKKKSDLKSTSFQLETTLEDTKNTAPGPKNLMETPEIKDSGYFYYCLECDGCSEDDSCDHRSHPRHLVGYDIAEHFRKTGHLDCRPIGEFMKLGEVEDVAHSAQWGNTVRKRWKQMVIAGTLKTRKYAKPRSCKRKACFESLEDPLATFKHIRTDHL